MGKLSIKTIYYYIVKMATIFFSHCSCYGRWIKIMWNKTFFRPQTSAQTLNSEIRGCGGYEIVIGKSTMVSVELIQINQLF